MIRSRTLVLGTLLAIVAAAALPAAAQSPIAYVDISHLLLNSDRGKEIQQTLRTEFAEQMEKMRSNEKTHTELRSRISSQSLTLSQDTLEQMRRELEDLQIEMQRMNQDVERDVKARRAELYNVLEKEVLDLLEEIRKEKGLAIIFDKNGAGFLVTDPALDITSEVMQRLNSKP